MDQPIRAAVLTAPEQIEIREYERPSVADDEALLRVELAGICGTDWKYFSGKLPTPYPIILGHEILGHIEEIGGSAAERYRVQKGDRVLVEGSVPCWACGDCRSGNYRFCERKQSYGTRTSSDRPPHLWGAMAELLFLAPGSIVHRIGADVSPGVAISGALLANAIEWLRMRGNVSVRDDVLIQGCGPQGLAAVVIGRECGARRVMVSGLSRDRARLDLALRLGADHVLEADREDVPATIRDLTAGRGADVVLDVSGSASTTATSIQAVRRLGTVVLAGLSGKGALASIEVDQLVWNEIRLQGVYVKGEEAYSRALDFIEKRSAVYPIAEIVSHTYPLERAAEAIRAAGSGPSPEGFVKAAIAP